MGASGPMGAFDNHHPPRQDLIADCVHCGFCLPACPTYTLWGTEADSPRGRIHLMAQGLQGEPLTESMVAHFDRCLGCLACVPACPSGVRYDRLIADTRQQVERRHHRPLRERLLRWAIFGLFPYPRRLRLLRGPLWAYHASGAWRWVAPHLPPTLATLESLAPKPSRALESLPPKPSRAWRLPERLPAKGKRRAVVGMLTGCVQSVFFPEVNAATARVLAAEGCDVVIPRAQGCCGALSAHTGREAEARRFARAVLDAFDTNEIDYLVGNAAGCGSVLKDYPALLADDPRAAAFSAKVRDLSEVLVELDPVAPRHPLPVTVAYHDACHLGHAQGIRAQPRRLLRDIPGLVLREIADGELCCGSAGIWNILNPGPARELAARKAANVLATGAQLVVTANPGCLLQIAAGIREAGGTVGLAHIATVLDASIRGLPELTRRG